MHTTISPSTHTSPAARVSPYGRSYSSASTKSRSCYNFAGITGRSTNSNVKIVPATDSNSDNTRLLDNNNRRSENQNCSNSKSRRDDKILFLDVDGVLHSYFAKNDSQLFRKDCMQRLKTIVDQTGCKIVLSSSWRQTPEGRATVNEQLANYGIDNIIDSTRIFYNEYNRHTDIQDWVKKHPTDRWIALDDLPMHQLGAHYIGTAPEDGITDDDMERAIRQLNINC